MAFKNGYQAVNLSHENSKDWARKVLVRISAPEFVAICRRWIAAHPEFENAPDQLLVLACRIMRTPKTQV
jgi:hypothetical protein